MFSFCNLKDFSILLSFWCLHYIKMSSHYEYLIVCNDLITLAFYLFFFFFRQVMKLRKILVARFMFYFEIVLYYVIFLLCIEILNHILPRA